MSIPLLYPKSVLLTSLLEPLLPSLLDGGAVNNNYIFQNGDNFVFQDGENYVFNDDIDADQFRFTVKSDNTGTSNNDQFTVPTVSGGTYDLTTTVDWGDGTIDTNMSTFNDARWTHTFPADGIYTVKITGTFTGLQFNDGGDKEKLTNVNQWGVFNSGNTVGTLYGCSNLTITATDAMDLTGVTTLQNFFRDCSSITTIPGITGWITGSITSFSATLSNCSSFNQALTGLDMSSATTLFLFLNGATLFNSDVSGWGTTSSVTTYAGCFQATPNFNQPVNDLNTSGATALNAMFFAATIFNQPVSNFVTTSVALFNSMFSGTALNQDITNFNLEAATDLSNMLTNADLSTANYDAFLIEIESQTLNSGLTLGAQNMTFTADAINVLTLVKGGSVTVTTDGNHGLVPTDEMAIVGADQSDYNVPAPVSLTPATDVFTYLIAGSPVSPATGTISCYRAEAGIARQKLVVNDAMTILDNGAA